MKNKGAGDELVQVFFWWENLFKGVSTDTRVWVVQVPKGQQAMCASALHVQDKTTGSCENREPFLGFT